MSREGLLILVLAAALPAATAQDREGVEYFELHIRPLLAEKCYACHSAETMAMGELRVDSADGLLRGGSRGPALAPGDAAASLLLKAVSYNSLELKMPPTGKLAAEQIAHLEAWIRMGAPDPRTATATPAVEEGIDLATGRQFWSFRPVRDPVPPEVPGDSWARNPIDRFILSRMADAGLQPAPDADRRTLLRRVTFDLTGLPPSPTDIEAFLEDASPDAFARAVERLLGSPHYGERWGRHWLDLVRWAETNGHEFDNNKLDAWRYRDYVIEAFNSDLPYTQFLKEQIAGDLLPPRLSSDGTHYVNPVAAGMYWLWEVLNSPTDSIQARADIINNQIDVLTKATQGLTVACARCHDHKFDPIPTADYYSLFGILNSIQMSEVCIDSPERKEQIRAAAREIADINREIEAVLRPGHAHGAAGITERLLAAAEESEDEDRSPLALELEYALTEPSHPLYLFAKASQPIAEGEGFAARMAALREEMAEWSAKADRDHPIWKERRDEIYEDFEEGLGKWSSTGEAFGGAPIRSVPADRRMSGYAGQALAASFGGGSNGFVGTLTTDKFRMPARYVHVRMAGDPYSSRLREVAALRFTVIADEHKSGHAMPSGEGRLRWHTIAMTKERGRICAIEIIDRDRDGAIAVDQIVFSWDPKPPPVAGPLDARVLAIAADESINSIGDLAQAYGSLADGLASDPDRSNADQALLAAITGQSRLEDGRQFLSAADAETVDSLAERRRRANDRIPPSTFAMSSQDWKPSDSPIHIRGNHENPGAIAPRQFLQVIAGSDQEPFRDGSGRLELARWVASERNPLTARVLVNRVWHHHFGRGIVASTDDFGRMGEQPSHPDLLDHLASRFVASGWSVKDLHRLIVLSSTYRMSSVESSEALESDPSNRLLSRFPVRRLEAEAIRDSVLAVAGSLDPSVGGPSVPPHISEYQDGRGKPKSGPIDGLGRRSVYMQVRRNFLPPLFLAFDYPLPISAEGRRGVSAVASQALLMLNNQFVAEQAERWARQVRSASQEPHDRLRGMYLRAYGRPPVESEIEQLEEFLSTQVDSATDAGSSADRWTDLAHAMLNTAEFLFLR